MNQEEAERRASICVECKDFNVDLHVACPSCTRLDELISEVKGDRTTSRDAELKNCLVCRCHNQTSIWMPNESIAKKGLSFPDWCWKKDQ